MMDNLSAEPGYRPWFLTPGGVAAIAIVALPLMLALKRLLFPTFDTREPPVLRPKVPVVGHLISMIRERSGFHRRLYKESSLPICTLPMLAGKMYFINSPNLISAAMRNKDLSFDTFTRDFCIGGLGITQEQLRLYFEENALEEINGIIHSSLIGEDLKDMTAIGLNAIAAALNNIKPDGAMKIADSFDWVRKMMAEGLFKGLFGENSPMSFDDMDDMWTFEKKVGILCLNIANKVLAADALAARDRLRARILPWYKAEGYKAADVSPLIKKRAKWQLGLGLSYEDICGMEFVMPWAASTNSVPTFFWLLVYTHSKPHWKTIIRKELEHIVEVSGDESTGRTATLEIAKLKKECPVLLACYHEATRLCNASVGNRNVTKDTILKDSSDGREYLLTKGTNIQWAAGVTQTDEKVWGAESQEFDPSKWIDMPAATYHSFRKSMIPFGGGKTLCPGRHFAESEILSCLGAITLLFEIDDVSLPSAEDPILGTGIRIPVWGDKDPGFKLQRRPDWEDVSLRFIT